VLHGSRDPPEPTTQLLIRFRSHPAGSRHSIAASAVSSTACLPCFSRARGSDTPQGSGHVVQITTSPLDHAIAGIPSVLASLTKGSLNAATKSLAIEYAKRGILAHTSRS